MGKEQKEDKYWKKSVKALQNLQKLQHLCSIVQCFLEPILFFLHLHDFSLGVLFSFHPKMLDIGNTPAVALDQGGEIGHRVLRCKCLLLLISSDGSNEED